MKHLEDFNTQLVTGQLKIPQSVWVELLNVPAIPDLTWLIQEQLRDPVYRKVWGWD